MDRGGETGTYGAAQPIERLDRLDVDAARDRVGTVDCRRTVLQDFNAIDHALRHRVEVDEIAEAALAYTVDPAMPVDENEDPVAAAFAAAEIAQVDRAGAVGGALRAVRLEADATRTIGRSSGGERGGQYGDLPGMDGAM